MSPRSSPRCAPAAFTWARWEVARTQAARRERLLADGLTQADLDRLRGPIGLDLGGREPAEMALAILAEIVAERNNASATPLSKR